LKVGKYPDGKATGQAVTLFASEDDAKAACQELNKKYIGNRYVDLSLISKNEYDNFNEVQG
jgi:hypothetical protein